MADEFDPGEVPESLRSAFESGYMYDAAPTGCFVLETVQAERTYAGIDAIGFLRWFGTSESVRFNLYASSDAGYKATVAFSRAGFTGKGVSWGAGVAAPGFGPDALSGRRLGPPEVERCVEAARRASQK